MLTPQQHIIDSGIIGKTVANRPISKAVFEHNKFPYLDKVGKLSSCASAALATAATEWTLFRLTTAETYPSAYMYVEAAWAGIIDLLYLNNFRISVEGDLVPKVLGCFGTYRACDLLARVFHYLLKPDNYNDALLTETCLKLARDVQPQKKHFDAWLEAAFERLTLLYPKPPIREGAKCTEIAQTIIGAPVPRQALETTTKFDMAQADNYLDKYLQNLDYTNNPYLRTPEEMLELGFTGVPYRWETN